jgi:hypothetical protein
VHLISGLDRVTAFGDKRRHAIDRNSDADGLFMADAVTRAQWAQTGSTGQSSKRLSGGARQPHEQA